MNTEKNIFFKVKMKDFPHGPMVKSLPSHAMDAGSIPCQRTKIPHSVGALSLAFTSREPSCCSWQSPGTPEPCSLQLQRSLGATTVKQLKIDILKSGNRDMEDRVTRSISYIVRV